MKKIINGKVYDTETAKLIGEFSQCENSENYWCIESLFQKKTGEFFLYGQGGNASKYAVSGKNNTWAGGEQIIPLNYDAAREWAEDHLSVGHYAAIFGAIREDDTKSTLTLYLSVSAIERAKRAASQAGLSLSAYIESKI